LKNFFLICAGLSLAVVALPISINEWIKVEKYRRQRQAEIQRAADDAALSPASPGEESEWEKNQRESEKIHREWENKDRAWENFSKQLHRQIEEDEARDKRDEAEFQKDMEQFKFKP
jgi:hypothetical protein